jgi:hypothetical protein
MRTSLGYFDAAVEHGGCVISAESNVVLSLVAKTTASGASATYYVTKPQYDAVMDGHWTEERRKYFKLERVAVEEQQRIESELGIKDVGFLYSNRISCDNCGSVYGAFEFIQQGIREHGKEAVETALTLANAAVVRVNPTAVAVCQNCKTVLRKNHSYICNVYGCNRVE